MPLTTSTGAISNWGSTRKPNIEEPEAPDRGPGLFAVKKCPTQK